MKYQRFLCHEIFIYQENPWPKTEPAVLVSRSFPSGIFLTPAWLLILPISVPKY